MPSTGKSQAVILKEFFGMKPGQTLTDFMAEIKALSPLEKDQLASAAAREMKVPAEQLAFATVAY